jgi:bisdemethoxycurcumin synthase
LEQPLCDSADDQLAVYNPRMVLLYGLLATFPDFAPKSYLQMSPVSAAVTWPLPSRAGTAAAISLRSHGTTCSRTTRAYCSAAASRLPADAREIRQAQRSDGPATVLAIGKENPVNCIPQDEYVDWYFRVTNCEHLTKLKAKMKRISKHEKHFCKFATDPSSSPCIVSRFVLLLPAD